ncbi:hypothetical protein M404DRAFT_1004857 [Pisolithus tinctorius Marx 270]|uniref:Uncharacterized protein n=1 Tax=Pisolithus tinctorius Marx 270 TaxID=870435 RepID=A0A0C3NDJ3_PISTI|nr:hypothetical protein M404DRAFT_1004857 [Pisolithus tinctorius Marx 270]
MAALLLFAITTSLYLEVCCVHVSPAISSAPPGYRSLPSALCDGGSVSIKELQHRLLC